MILLFSVIALRNCGNSIGSSKYFHIFICGTKIIGRWITKIHVRSVFMYRGFAVNKQNTC